MSTLSRASLLFALVAAVPACSTTVETNETGGSGGGSTVEPPPGPESKQSRCGFGHDKETVLVAARGSDLVFVRDDGSHFVATTFPSHGDTDDSSLQLGVAGGFVAAIGFTFGVSSAHGRVALLDVDGHILFSEDLPHTVVDSVFVSDKGDAVFGDSSTGRTIVAHADGTHQIAEHVIPLGPPDATGHFPAAAAPIGDVATYGWAAAGHELAPLELGGAGVYPLLAGDQLVYVGADADGATVLVRETSSATKAFTLPSSAMVADVSATTSSGWVALQSGIPARSFLAAPNAGAKPVKDPTNQKAFGMASFHGIQLTDDPGEALFIGRDSARGGLFHSTDGGASWSPIGPTFSAITSLGAIVRGGTYVLAATDEPGYFEVEPWKKPASASDAPDHVGPAVFAVRPADGIQRKLPIQAGISTDITLDASGVCAAFVGVDGAVHGFDVKSDHGGVLLHGDAVEAVAWLR